MSYIELAKMAELGDTTQLSVTLDDGSVGLRVNIPIEKVQDVDMSSPEWLVQTFGKEAMEATERVKNFCKFFLTDPATFMYLTALRRSAVVLSKVYDQRDSKNPDVDNIRDILAVAGNIESMQHDPEWPTVTESDLKYIQVKIVEDDYVRVEIPNNDEETK